MLDGYQKAWTDGRFDLYFRNSLFVTIVSLFFIVFLGSLAAYALANWRGRTSALIYLLFIAGLMLPIRLGTINIFQIVQLLGLTDTVFSLLPVYVAMGLPMAVFVLTSFMRGIPHELIDAALTRKPRAHDFVIQQRSRPAVARHMSATGG